MRCFWAICVMLIGLPAFGTEWGAMWDYEEEREVSPAVSERTEQPASARPAKQPGQSFLLKDILAGKTLALYLDQGVSAFSVYRNNTEGSASDTAPVQRPESQEQLEQQALVQGLYEKWFSYAADTIRKAHREKEFSDVLDILDRGVSIRWVDHPSQADIVFRITSLEEVERACRGEGVLGCYTPSRPPVIYLPFNTGKNAATTIAQVFNSPRVSTKEVGLHEVGHSLGLSDQYDAAADVNSHAVYASSKQGTGIMNNVCHGKLFGKCHLTCDDVDGLINLIDITRAIASERNEYGWRSFCRQSKDVYSYGKPASRAPLSIGMANIEQGVELVKHEGRQALRQMFTWEGKNTLSPFDSLTETVVQRDVQGRAVEARGPHGEEIYYAYHYRGKVRLVTKDHKALLLENILPGYALGKGRRVYPLSHYFLFKKGNKKVSVESFWSRHQGGKIAYLEGDSFSEEPSYSLELYLDKKQQVIREKESSVSSAPVSHPDEPVRINPQKREDRLGQVIQEQAVTQQENSLRRQMLQYFREQYSKRK